MRNHIWLQRIGGNGALVDPASVPPERLKLAIAAIEQALEAGETGAPVAARPGLRLLASVEGRRLVLTLVRGEIPIVTIAVAPRHRDGTRLWLMVRSAAQEQGFRVAAESQPDAPWAVVLIRQGVAHYVAAADLDWLSPLEAELAAAWCAIAPERREAPE